MYAWRKISIPFSQPLEEFTTACFKRGGHDRSTLNDIAERAHAADRHDLLEEIDRLIAEHGDVTVKRGDVLGS